MKKIILFSVLLLLCGYLTIDAQTDCGRNSSYEFVEMNDSTVELRVSINGHSGKVDYYIIKSENVVPLPKFNGRYKDCLVFMHGYGQHYRRLTVFQVSNDMIIKEDYEHEMCLESDGKESYLFFYDGQPIKMTYNYRTTTVKFKKLRNRGEYEIFKGKTIVSCENKFYVAPLIKKEK